MISLSLPTHCSQLSASDFVKQVTGLTHAKREEAALEALFSGNVPSYMRDFVPLTISFVDVQGTPHVLTFNVLPDYLTIGTDTDRLRMPLTPLGAQRVADAWGCVLPTTKLVTITWNAANKLPPQPWGPPYDASMISTDRFVRHNARVEATVLKLGVDPTKLVAGHKKDVVMTNQLIAKPKQVAIFGWHQSNGKPIQPLYLGHENLYLDYSHGIRMVSRACVLDGQDDDIARILQEQSLSVGVSSEGPLRLTRQPGV